VCATSTTRKTGGTVLRKQREQGNKINFHRIVLPFPSQTNFTLCCIRISSRNNTQTEFRSVADQTMNNLRAQILYSTAVYGSELTRAQHQHSTHAISSASNDWRAETERDERPCEHKRDFSLMAHFICSEWKWGLEKKLSTQVMNKNGRFAIHYICKCTPKVALSKARLNYDRNTTNLTIRTGNFDCREKENRDEGAFGNGQHGRSVLERERMPPARRSESKKGDKVKILISPLSRYN
jgi:hypothetical protein